MSEAVRVALISYDADGFSLLHAACEQAGHAPSLYIHAPLRHPGSLVTPEAAQGVASIAEALPAGVSLAVVTTREGLRGAVAGHRSDLVVCYGFGWRVPGDVLSLPRLGVLNVHTSLLPRHRGPMPIHWAIRNGDPETGVTVHRMDGGFDTGRILARRGGIALPDDLDGDRLFDEVQAAVRDVVPEAVQRAVAGEPGEPQDESQAGYEPFMGPEAAVVDWGSTARDIHNLVRTYEFGRFGIPGPIAMIDGRWSTLHRTSLTGDDGRRMTCGDGPLWVREHAPLQ